MEDIRALPTANHSHNNNSTKFKHRISASASNDESNYSANKFGSNLNNWKYKRHSMDNLFDAGIKTLESTFQVIFSQRETHLICFSSIYLPLPGLHC